MDRVDLKRVQIKKALDGRAENSAQPVCVREVMTAAPTTVDASTTVLELVRLLQKHGFRHLLVTHSDGTLAGILSDRDVIRCFGPERYPDERRLSGIRAAEIMSSDLITVTPTTRIEVAIDILIAHGISCLPVVVDEQVVGILTNTDLHLLLEALLTRDSRISSVAAHALHAS